MNAATAITTLREFEGVWIDDGYEFIGVGRENGWSAISGWGEDGWDLGDWPYVVVLFRDCSLTEQLRVGTSDHVSGFQSATRYERAIYIEGDITIETFASAAERQSATDEMAAFHWRHASRDHGDELQSVLAATPPGAPLPERFRGPYRRKDS